MGTGQLQSEGKLSHYEGHGQKWGGKGKRGEWIIKESEAEWLEGYDKCYGQDKIQTQWEKREEMADFEEALKVETRRYLRLW